MEITNLADYVVLLAIIAGVTELIKRIRARDYWTVVTVLTAVFVGALFGAVHYYADLDWAKGAALGFAATGAVATLATRSTPAPSAALDPKK